MANNQITIKPNANEVEAQGLNRFITVTNNVTGTTVTLTQTNPEVIRVSGPGPAGISGASGTSGTSGTSGALPFPYTGSAQISGSLSTTGSITATNGITGSILATGPILPYTDEAYDIGSPEKGFRDLYLSGSSIFLGGSKITVDESGDLNIFASGSDTPSGLSGSFTGSILSTDFTFDGETLNVLGNVFVQGTLDAATKNFKIDHPTIPEYYLVHSSLEGPERGIYYRGKLEAIDTIHLPDYWNELTDDTDITVQLTPIGNSCQHFVKSVTKKEIIVGCDCGTPHCFYIVHAQRFNEGKFNILEPKKTKSL